MTHLTPERLLELIDGDAAGGDSHLASCERCRREVHTLRQVQQQLLAVPVQEPSPLFWDQLSRRIHVAVENDARQPERPSRRWLRPLAWGGSLAMACAAYLLLVVAPARKPADVVSRSAAVTATMASSDGRVEGDASWQALSDLVGEVGLVADGPIQAEPGAAELLVDDLSAGERASLVALLREELPRP